MKNMYDPEYQLPCGRNYAEHKRLIRQMGKGVVPPNPIARAMCEMAATAVGCGVWIALCVMAWQWFLMI